MSENCGNCGKKLEFLEERIFKTVDGKKMILCLKCSKYQRGIINELRIEKICKSNQDILNVIKKFIDKYKNAWTYNDDKFNMLRSLINEKYNKNIGKRALWILIDHVKILRDTQEYKQFKTTILSDKPDTKEECVDAFLKRYGENSGKDDFLHAILKENWSGLDPTDIRQLLDKRKNLLKLENWENSLTEKEDNVKEDINIDFLTGREFEIYIKELFEKMGYKAELTPPTGDKGADVIVEKFGEKTAVQTKRYNSDDHVGVSAIQEVYASKKYYECHKALIVTTSSFTTQAIDIAKSTDVETWDRTKLDEKIAKYITNVK